MSVVNIGNGMTVCYTYISDNSLSNNAKKGVNIRVKFNNCNDIFCENFKPSTYDVMIPVIRLCFKIESLKPIRDVDCFGSFKLKCTCLFVISHTILLRVA